MEAASRLFASSIYLLYIFFGQIDLLISGVPELKVMFLQVLRHKKGRYGVGAICNGGGGASALVLELM